MFGVWSIGPIGWEGRIEEQKMGNGGLGERREEFK
jgi:hypothetical protein